MNTNQKTLTANQALQELFSDPLVQERFIRLVELQALRDDNNKVLRSMSKAENLGYLGLFVGTFTSGLLCAIVGNLLPITIIGGITFLVLFAKILLDERKG